MTKEEIDREIKFITSQIIEKYKPQKIVLFGSAAAGNAGPDSDLDFLIVKKNTPYLGRDRMRQLRGLINKNMAADFLVYRPEEIEEGLRGGDPFLRSIIAKGKVLYG